jgi:amino acid transporter
VSTSQPQLRRELTKWDLTAIGVNQVIGGAVFAAPAALAASLGGLSWIAVGLVGLLAMAVALNFAEAGSRVDATGGPYLYTRAAFGRFVGFEVGWIGWLVRVTSWASVVNVLVSAAGYYWPNVTTGVLRTTLVSAVVAAIMALNIRGIKQSSIVLNALTIGKLTPLAIFIVLGLPHISAEALRVNALPSWPELSAASLLLIFTFGGYEIIPVPAGEAKDPQQAVPFAMIAAITTVAIVITLAQMVALGTLPGLPTSKTPLADAAAIFIGPAGAALMTIGAMISVAGNNVGAALSGSRMLFALSEQGDLPRIFGHVHARYRTPDVAIVVTCVTTLVLALSGSFVQLAAISAIARLLVYGGTCASVLALRRQGRAPFTIPFGPLVPLIALAVCAAILLGVSADQFMRGSAALAVGAILFLIATKKRPQRSS